MPAFLLVIGLQIRYDTNTKRNRKINHHTQNNDDQHIGEHFAARGFKHFAVNKADIADDAHQAADKGNGNIKYVRYIKAGIYAAHQYGDDKGDDNHKSESLRIAFFRSDRVFHVVNVIAISQSFIA